MSKIDTTKEIVVIARRILENVEAGRIYVPATVQWARRIVEQDAEPHAQERADFPTPERQER